MNFSKEIILACEVGIKVLDTIKDYTKRMESTENDVMRETYADNRFAVLPHIQSQIVSITAMLYGKEPISSDEFEELDEPATE